MNGVGDAFSTDHFGTNFLARKQDFVLAVDCPDSYRNALNANDFKHGDGALAVEHIDAMIITHLHGDHVNGLEMVAAYRRFAKGGRLKLYTSPEVAEVLWDRRLAVSLGTLYNGETFETMQLEDFLEMHVMAWDEEISIGPFTIAIRRTLHHIPAMAMRISDGQATLGYSCDTVFDPELIDWLQDSELVLHESTFGVAHTPLYKLLELPEPLREKMLVVHYPDEMIGAEIDGLTLASQGEIYAVGKSD